jgi:hypothetical protein
MQLFCMERYATREEAWIQTMSLGFADPPWKDLGTSVHPSIWLHLQNLVYGTDM